MNELYVTYIHPQQLGREERRALAEREHPNGLSPFEIRDALGKAPSFRMRMQSIISNIRQPIPSAPSRRIQPKPISNRSHQL